LSDSGLTESYNAAEDLGDGEYRIGRAYNTQSGELLNTLALTVRQFQLYRSKNPSSGIGTSPTVLNKVLSLYHSINGIKHCYISSNLYGKTLRHSPNRRIDEWQHLHQFIEVNSEDLQATTDSQVTLTEAGAGKDWVTHLPDANRALRLIERLGELWMSSANRLRSAIAGGQIRSGRSPFEVFSALADCTGEVSPEWGTGTISDLIDMGLKRVSRGEVDEAARHFGAAGHKVRVLEDCAGILREGYLSIMETRNFDPISQELQEKLAVLPPRSMLLQLIQRIIASCEGTIGHSPNPKVLERLHDWAALFRHQFQYGLSGTHARPPQQLPEHDFVGYIAFVDLLGMKKLSELRPQCPVWCLQTSTQIGIEWASMCGALAARPVIDGVVGCFNGLYPALRFCAGAHVHVGELYSIVSEALQIPSGLITGLCYGNVSRFQTLVGPEETGTGIAAAYSAGKAGGQVGIGPEIIENHFDELKALGLSEFAGTAGNAHFLDAAKCFETLLLSVHETGVN